MLVKRYLSVSSRYLKETSQYSYLNSFKTWKDEILNYDDLDEVLQDEVIKYSLPYYHMNLLVENDRTKATAYNVKTHLDGPRPSAIVDNIDSNSNSQWFLNELRTEKYPSSEPIDSRHIVILHGFAASSVWWCKNIAEIIDKSTLPKTSNTSIHLHSIDMMGFGLSGRPDVIYPSESKAHKQLDIEFSNVSIGKDSYCISCGGRIDGRKDPRTWCNCGEPKLSVKTRDILNYLPQQSLLVNEVEEIYVESLEQWRIANKLDNFDIVSHSLGAYMACAYALKYPNRVKKLVLTSPGGMERSPFAVTNPSYTQLIDKLKSNEAIPDKMTSNISNDVNSYDFLGRYFKTNKVFRNLWNTNTSFFWLIRWLGPLGPKIIFDEFESKFSRGGAFSDPHELNAFIRYMYSTYIRSSFSETSINRIFSASIVGKVPILDKLKSLNEEQFTDSFWMFGQYDIMYSKTGQLAMEELISQGKKSKFEVIKDAGHNVPMDNYQRFNENVIDYLNL